MSGRPASIRLHNFNANHVVIRSGPGQVFVYFVKWNNMPHTCVVHGCTSRSNPSVKRGFFKFPKIRQHEGPETEDLSRERRRTWISRINRKDFTPTEYSKVCSDHFVQGEVVFLNKHEGRGPSSKRTTVSVVGGWISKICSNKIGNLLLFFSPRFNLGNMG